MFFPLFFVSTGCQTILWLYSFTSWRDEVAEDTESQWTCKDSPLHNDVYSFEVGALLVTDNDTCRIATAGYVLKFFCDDWS